MIKFCCIVRPVGRPRRLVGTPPGRRVAWSLAAAVSCAAALPALADTIQAYCAVYPRGEDHTRNEGACRFSQRQGHVTIRRGDGVVHDLRPVADTAGTYLDASGQAAYREGGLESEGLIFRLAEESVYVYWRDPRRTEDHDNPTAPFTTTDYDATSRLACVSATGVAGTCPAGVLRMGGGEGSVVLLTPDEKELTINILADYVNATRGEAEARREGDRWIIVIDGAERYEIPEAFLTGG